MKPRKIVILVEETSMKSFLDQILPNLGLSCTWQIIPHQGKSDLERSAPRKVKAWVDSTADVRFVVVRDNDGGDCRLLKQRLINTCSYNGRRLLVRIVIQELESWLLSDFEALDKAYPDKGVSSLSQKSKFRDPDSLTNANEVFEHLTKDFGKIQRARRVGLHFDLTRSKSKSLKAFVHGLQRLQD